MTLHTRSGCSINNSGFSGQLKTPNCDINAPGQFTNEGCGIRSNDGASYGQGFNARGGGVYATEWTSQAINIWFFPRGSVPGDLSSGKPNPKIWGTPAAKFQGGCNIDEHFRDHNIIFDVTFCGDWAGNVWGQDPVCASKASSCQAFVQNNPGAFADAFWQVNSLKVYSADGGSKRDVTSVAEEGINAVASPGPVGVRSFQTTKVSERSQLESPDSRQAQTPQKRGAHHRHMLKHHHHKRY